MTKTSSGLQENVAGLLCYILGWVSGLIFLLIETENKFVRFHAVQSIIVFGTLNIFAMVFFWIPFIGGIVGGLAIALLIVLMIKAYQGTMYKLPVVGDLAEKWTRKPEK